MTESEAATYDEIGDDDQQLIKLCLKKPKKWNWELTTSKSSSNIAFPTIQLFDETTKTILAEASEAGFVASSKLSKSASVSKASSLRRNSLKMKIHHDSISEIFMEPVITEPDDEKRRKSRSPAPVQWNSERDMQLRDAKPKDSRKNNEKPRSRPSSSNSMRSRSSVSILERISELRRSLSSESEDENEIKANVERQNRKYSYRTCNLGTLIVPKESFSQVRRRPQKAENTGEL